MSTIAPSSIVPSSIGQSTLAVRALALAALSVPCLLGCGDPGASVEPEPAGDASPGTLSMPLATIVNDVRYRLSASFSLSGPVTIDRMQENGSGTILVASLPEGDYEVTLRDGWELERQRESSFERVVAWLASPNPRPIHIESGADTLVAWVFRTDGEPVALEPPGFFQGNLAVSDSSNPGTSIFGDVLATEFGHLFALAGILTIQGSLTLTGDLDSLAELASLARVEGDLVIDGTALTSLAGLESLTEVGGSLAITNNASLPTCAAEALVARLGVDPADAEISGNDDSGTCP